MTLVAGIDPGTNGAIAVYDTETQGVFSCEDIPIWYQTIGSKKRKRLDAIALQEVYSTFQMLDVKLLVLEAVGGRPGQSASAGFTFGATYGMIYMAAMYSKIMVETVPPASWKKIMNVPGKNKASDDDIMNRADELFPHDRHLFRGKMGGKRVDRAEAAMLAKFGGEVVLRSVKDFSPMTLLEGYRKGETGV